MIRWRALRLRSGQAWLLLIAAVVLNGLLREASTPLWDQDEAAYAGFARHMVQSGDWVVPQFMWSAAHRKPPLLLWGIAASFKVLGESEMAVRLPSLLAMFAAFASLWWLGRRLFGEERARLAAVVLATSLLLPNMGKVAFPDCWLFLCETVAPLALLLAVKDPGWRWTCLFWSAVALGVLAKGPPILILAGGLFAWLAIFHPLRRNLLRLHPWFGLPLALLPFAGWAYLAWERTHGELIRWMYEWYIARRARGGTVFGQIGPPGYHLAVMFAGVMPWSAFLPAAVVRMRDRWQDSAVHFLRGWLLFGWVVWELMPSKLPAYAIGAYPAVALLIAGEIEWLDAESWKSRLVRWSADVTALVAIVAAVVLVGAAVKLDLGSAAEFGAAMMLFVVCLGAAAAWSALRAGQRNRLVGTLAAGGLVFAAVAWIGVMPAIDSRRALGKAIAEVVKRVSPPDATIVYVGDLHIPSLPFYVGQERAHQIESPLFPHRSGDVAVMAEDAFAALSSHVSGHEVTKVDGWDFDHRRQASIYIVSPERPLIGAIRDE